ncbi:MAG: hypothetical protein V1846_02890 [Candidatus Komeilibacteria bacterium]
MSQPKLSNSALRWFYFLAGIIATIAYRIINFLGKFDPIWVNIAWYIGTIGFIIYFAHRFQISERRAKVIADQRLIETVDHTPGLSAREREGLQYVLHSLESSKEKWNYIVIFVVSGLALLVAVYTDFLVR